MSPHLPPIVRTISVSWAPAAAFERFTGDFGRWWPVRTHSIGSRRVERVVFEGRAGGRIFEQHVGGRRFAWGQVLEWDPPRRVVFTWHPSREPASAQQVEVRFHPEAGGTRVELVSSCWENWGRGARRARRGYDVGWGYVLNVWAGRRTAGMRALDGVAGALGLVQRLRGGAAAAIERAAGEIPSAGER